MDTAQNEYATRVKHGTSGPIVTTYTASTLPGEFHFAIAQGSTLSLPITWVGETGIPVDLTSYTARLTARVNVGDTATVLAMTSANAQLVLTAATGKITLTLTAVETAALTGWVRAQYDLEMILSATVRRLLTGTVTLLKEVTR